MIISFLKSINSICLHIHDCSEYPDRPWGKLPVAFYFLVFPSHVTILVLSLRGLIQQADQICCLVVLLGINSIRH